jgi:hypothetical protein
MIAAARNTKAAARRMILKMFCEAVSDIIRSINKPSTIRREVATGSYAAAEIHIIPKVPDATAYAFASSFATGRAINVSVIGDDWPATVSSCHRIGRRGGPTASKIA